MINDIHFINHLNGYYIIQHSIYLWSRLVLHVNGLLVLLGIAQLDLVRFCVLRTHGHVSRIEDV